MKIALAALFAGAIAFGASQVKAQTINEDPAIVVTLLGTGSPDPAPDRFSAATLIQAGGVNLLFDAGRGATIRLGQLGIPLGSIDTLFLTHLHSDHIVGLPDVWLMSFINPNFGGRRSSLHVVGPAGTNALVHGISVAFDADVKIRIADQKVAPEATLIDSNEFDQDGNVYSRNGVTVKAFKVDHGELVKPAYGYRVDYAGHSVVLSGDTKFSQAVIDNAKNVDLLVHEVAAAPEALAKLPWVRDIMAHHTSAQECGIVFTRAQPKLAAYSHLVFLSSPTVPPLTAGQLSKQTRETYDGPLVVGADLMQFSIGKSVQTRELLVQTK